MHRYRQRWSLAMMCRVLEVSRSGYYRWLQRKPPAPDTLLQSLIRSIAKASRHTYGSRRIKVVLQQSHGRIVSRRRIARMMREMGLKVGPRRFRPQTTDSRHHYPVAANLLQQDFKVEAPNQVYVGDITYLATQEGWLYLATVIDLYARTVIGWAMKDSLATPLVTEALEHAASKRTRLSGAIFHSDRGSQYASGDFTKLLKAYQMRQSMSAKGNCYDNAVAESFFHTLKTEWIHSQNFQTRKEAKQAVEEYINYYNRTRLHSFNEYRSPLDKEMQWWQSSHKTVA